MKKVSTQKMTVTAIMSAMAAVLMFIEFPLPFLPQFLKMDPSDLPAVIIAFSAGPVWGVAVELVKNLFHMSVSATGYVGEAANFLVGASFVLTAGLIYKKNHTRKGAVMALAMGTVCMTVFGILTNYFILLPFYNIKEPAAKLSLILYGITPFNAIKGVIISIITLFIYKPLSPILHRSARNKNGGRQ